MSSKVIKENDFVRFITREGPKMLVKSTHQNKAACIWIGDGGKHTATFKKDNLVKVGDKERKLKAGGPI